MRTSESEPMPPSVGFTARHVFTKVPGSFTKFAGTITVDRANLELSSIEATIEVGSVNTASYPVKIDVTNPTVTPSDVEMQRLAEQFGKADTFRMTKAVVLKVSLLGFGPGMQGAYVSGWEATTTLNRTDYGVDGPGWLGKAVGDDIPVSISIEADLNK